MKLYTSPISPFSVKVEIALIEKGLAYDRVDVPFSMQSYFNPKHEDVLRINPKGEIPVLVDGELEIFDSTVIFDYLEDAYPEPALWPSDLADRTKARLAELAADEIYIASTGPLVPPLPGTEAPSEEEQQAARAALDHIHQLLDEHLKIREWLDGTFSYADIGFYVALFYAELLGMTVDEKYEGLAAWRARVGGRESVAKVTGASLVYAAQVTGTQAAAE